MLTAIHFHYAGFFLPLLVGFAAPKVVTTSAQLTVLFVLLGVPLTAIGITVTQITGNHSVETFAAVFMATAGWLSAYLFLRISSQRDTPQEQILWHLAAIFLALGMLFAILYSLRFIPPLPWLDIPLMRALHGSLNSLGFALCGLTAMRKQKPATEVV